MTIGWRVWSTASALIAAAPASAAAADASALFGACFAAIYQTDGLAQSRGRRVAAMAVQFQGFADNLLASVIYRLRYGPKYGFSGDCSVAIDGGYSCAACANDTCDSGGESFKIFWSGGDGVRLVNDTTGVVGENAEGGRDYLRPGGEQGLFQLKRAAPEDCAW